MSDPFGAQRLDGKVVAVTGSTQDAPAVMSS